MTTNENSLSNKGVMQGAPLGLCLAQGHRKSGLNEPVGYIYMLIFFQLKDI